MTAPVVALHGFACSPRMWEPVLSHADMPALLGHAPSATPDSATDSATDSAIDSSGDSSGDFWAEVDRIADLFRPGGAARVFGYSMGARVALGLAVRHPELVEELTLVGANAGLETEAARHERRAWEDGWRRTLERDGIAAFAEAWEALPLWESQRALPEDLLARQRAARREHDPRGLSAALAVLGLGAMPNLWPALPELSAPVHVIAGALDSKFAALAERIGALAPRSRVSLVPGAGHNPILETPRALARLLR